MNNVWGLWNHHRTLIHELPNKSMTVQTAKWATLQEEMGSPCLGLGLGDADNLKTKNYVHYWMMKKVSLMLQTCLPLPPSANQHTASLSSIFLGQCYMVPSNILL